MLWAKEIDRRWLWAGAGLCIAAVSAYSITAFAPLLAIPFAILYAALFFINWKAAWWIFLFTIPLSQQLDLIEGSLTTTVPDEPIMWLFLLLTIVLVAARPRSFPEWWLRSPLTLVLALQYLWMFVAVCFSQNHFVSVKFACAKTWFLASYFVLPIFIFNKKSDFKKAFFIVVLPTIVTMLVINYWHYRLGFAFSYIHKAIGKLYYNRVDYSSFMSMLFPLLLVAVPLSKKLKWWWRALLIATILFFLMAIY